MTSPRAGPHRPQTRGSGGLVRSLIGSQRPSSCRWRKRIAAMWMCMLLPLLPLLLLLLLLLRATSSFRCFHAIVS